MSTIEQALVEREAMEAANGNGGVRTVEHKQAREPRFIIKPAWDERFFGWWAGFWVWLLVGSGANRTAVRRWRILRWLGIGSYGLVRSFLTAFFSRRIDDAAWKKRMESCLSCERLVVEVRKRDNTKRLFCAQCGCPNWFMSALPRKNRYKKWHCPLRRHEGQYPEQALERAREEWIVLSTEKYKRTSDG